MVGGAGTRSVLLAVAVSLFAAPVAWAPVAWAPAAWAQAGALDANAVVIGGTLTVAGQRDLDFGLVTQGSAPTIAVPAAGSGRWRVSGTPSISRSDSASSTVAGDVGSTTLHPP